MERSKNLVMSTRNFKPYRRVEQLEHTAQRDVAQKLKNIIYECFLKNEIVCSLGFGSFWQNFNNLKHDSDIDFFLLLIHQPDIKKVLIFGEKLKTEIQPLAPRYSLSPHIFMGNIYDVANGSENLIRCLTIHNPNIDSPLIIIGRKNIQLLSLIEEKNILSSLRCALFSIVRFFNIKILDNPNVINDKIFLNTQQKFIQRFIEAILLAQSFFQGIPVILALTEFSKFLNKHLTIKEINFLINSLWDRLNSLDPL